MKYIEWDIKKKRNNSIVHLHCQPLTESWKSHPFYCLFNTYYANPVHHQDAWYSNQELLIRYPNSRNSSPRFFRNDSWYFLFFFFFSFFFDLFSPMLLRVSSFLRLSFWDLFLIPLLISVFFCHHILLCVLLYALFLYTPLFYSLFRSLIAMNSSNSRLYLR